MASHVTNRTRQLGMTRLPRRRHSLLKAGLRRFEAYEVSLAEVLLLRALARLRPGSAAACTGLCALGRAYGASRRYSSTVSCLVRGAEGWAQLGERANALAAYLDASWYALRGGDHQGAGALLVEAAHLIGTDAEHERWTGLSALQAALAGEIDRGIPLAEAALHVQHSRWAACLGLVASGWIFLAGGMPCKALEALRGSEALLRDAYCETGDTDICNLAGELRAAVAQAA